MVIDWATRWVYRRSYRDQSEASSVDLLRRLQRVAPMKIKKVLTDTGSPFTDRLTSQTRTASGRHVFDVACSSMAIEHRLCPPRQPQTKGMVEHLNGRISDLVKPTRFASAGELDATLNHYMATYKHPLAQRALNHQSPIQALKRWQIDKPELFVKRVYKQAGLDG